MAEQPISTKPLVYRVIPWWWCGLFILVPCIWWWWCCRSCCGSTTTTTAAEPTIVVEEDDVGAWMVFDNGFYTPSTFDPSTVYFWPGVLFQLGAFDDAKFEFDYVELQSGGSMVAKYGPNDTPFAWINVVCDYPMTGGDTHITEPLEDPDRAFYLYPNDHVSNCCDDLIDIVSGISIDPCDGDDLLSCLRNRLLMSAMSTDDFIGLMTYWQGPEGFSVEASQGGDPKRPNSYEFFFEDEFRVELYRVEDGSMFEFAEYPSSSHPEVIDKIIVRAKERDPTGGAKQAPPWPDGEYP